MKSEPWFFSEGAPVTLNWPCLWSTAVDQYGERPAIQLQDQSISYRQLDHQAHALASELAHYVHNPHKNIIAVPIERPDFLKAYIAVWHLGGTVVPYSKQALEENSKFKIFLESFVDVWLADQYRPVIYKRKKPPISRIDAFPDEVSHHAIYFTSGSTGETKGVLRGWRQALYEAGHYAGVLDLRPGLQNVMLISPTFGASTKHLMASLLMGCAQSFPKHQGGNAKISNGHALYGTPAHFIGATSLCCEYQAGFEWISLTGELPSPAALKAASRFVRPNGKILNAFGGTEFGVVINEIIAPSDLDVRIQTRLPHKNPIILDDKDQTLPENNAGRLAVVSPHLAEGYIIRDGILSSARFIKFPRRSDRGTYVFTGDIAILDSDGKIDIHGRENIMIKHHGKWLDTSPLRALLSESDLIREFVIDRDPRTENLRVCIVAASHAYRSQLRVFCESICNRLCKESGLRAAHYFVINQILRNRNGKMDLQWLLDAAMEPLFSPKSSVIDDLLDYLMHGVFLDKHHFKDQSIISIGLDSIEILQLAAAFERHSRHPVDLSIFLEERSLSSLRAELWGNIVRRQWPLELGSTDSRSCLLWFGFSGINAVRREFGEKYRILYWDCDISINPDQIYQPKKIIKDMVQCCLQFPNGMLAKANSILVGGFSFGALMAHEAAHQLEELSIPVDQVLLLDPASIVGPQFNMPGRFVRFSIVRWLRKMPSQSWLMKRVEVIYRKGLRQTAIMTFKPSSVRSKTWVQTTRKRRRSIEELMGKTFSRVHWQNEETTSHLDIVLEPELQARWLEIIRLWGK